MSAVRVIVVDDEPLAREAVRLGLRAEPDMVVVGEAANGVDAVQLVKEKKPDVAFLDVQMPEMDGFQVLESAAPVHLPIVVFVTAYDRYALQAFDAHALDYLLKPFTRSRFAAAVDRARAAAAGTGPGDGSRRLRALLDERQRIAAAAGLGHLIRFAVKTRRGLVLVKVDDIDWIESNANYARLHVGNESHLVRMTMGEMEQRLDPARFARIHRSTIVQTNRIASIAPVWHGDYTVTLRDGTTLRLSRNYRVRLQQ